jgi:hypothetical protein
MFDRKIMLFLFIGLIALISINSLYEFKPLNKEVVSINPYQKDLELIVKDNAFVLTKQHEKAKLIEVSVLYYQEIGGKYIETDEVQEQDDIVQELFSNSILRSSKEDVYTKVPFFKIHEQANQSTYKNLTGKFSRDFLQNIEFIVYYKEGKIEKIKSQNFNPFEYNGKRISLFKSYQFEKNNSLIRNTQVEYTVRSNKYKVLVKTKFSI